MPRENQDKHSLVYISKSLFAGGIAGCAAKTAIAPLDRVKILFQTSNPRFEKYSGSFFGVFRAGGDILQQQGFVGLYQGHSATLLRIFPYAAIKFMSYEQLKSLFMPSKQDESHVKRFLAGSLAGCISVFFSYPLDMLRVRLALEGSNIGILKICSIIYSEPCRWTLSSTNPFLQSVARLSNFYRGFMPTMYGMIPYAGVSFLTYESLKTFASTHFIDYTTNNDTKIHKKPRLKAWAYLACGAISGALAQTSSYPLEVIRRVMQISGSQSAQLNSSQLNTIQTAMHIYKRKGFRGFWVGLSIGYLKVTPMFAVSFYVYEYMKKILDIEDKEN